MYQSTVLEGILGLSYPIIEGRISFSREPIYDNFPILLVKQGHIASRALSLYANDDQSTGGALLFGGIDTNKFDTNYVKAALDTCMGKVKLFSELPAYAGFYFRDEIEYDAAVAQRDFIPENKPRLAKLRDALASLEPFDHEHVGATLGAVAKELGLKTGVLVHPTRLACCGNAAGPSLYHLLAILGKQKVLSRLERALGKM